MNDQTSPKRRLLFTNQHGVTSRETLIVSLNMCSKAKVMNSCMFIDTKFLCYVQFYVFM